MDGLMLDMFRDVSGRGIEKTQVLKALRALSSWYGGQQLYIPLRAEKSELGDEILGVMADVRGRRKKIADITTFSPAPRLLSANVRKKSLLQNENIATNRIWQRVLLVQTRADCKQPYTVLNTVYAVRKGTLTVFFYV